MLKMRKEDVMPSGFCISARIMNCSPRPSLTGAMGVSLLPLLLVVELIPANPLQQVYRPSTQQGGKGGEK